MKIQALYFLMPILLVAVATDSAWALPQFDLTYGSNIFPSAENDKEMRKNMNEEEGETPHEMMGEEEGHGHTAHQHEKQTITYDCRACHINPTGGGMRNAHGRLFAVEQLPMMQKTDDMAIGASSAQITNYLSFGTDIRFAYLRTEDEASSRFKNSFFPMQADLYVAFIPTDYLTVYYQDGVEASGSRETFILLQNLLPFNGHLKAGRFTPPFGLKLDDHTTFIREKLEFGVDHSFGQDSGLEVGFGAQHLFGNAAIFNGGPFGGPGAADDNRDKGFSATAGVKLPSLWLAGSFYNNESEVDERTYAGGYGGLHFGRVTLLGEWDYFETDDFTANTENEGSVLLGEVDLHLTRGATAMVRYERCEDDDRSVCIDDVELERWTFGFYLYPTPFTEFILQYRKNLEDIEVNNDRFLAMLHVFY